MTVVSYNKRSSVRESDIPGWKGPRARTNILWRIRSYRSWVTVRYHLVLHQSVHFRFDRKLNNHGVTSTLRAFEPLAPRLQCPRSRYATNLVHRWNAIVFFFILNHAHCHHTARARLSSNHIQPLNNTKFHTATTSLRGPFQPGGHVTTVHIVLKRYLHVALGKLFHDIVFGLK